MKLPFLFRDHDRHGNQRLYVRKVDLGKVRLRQAPGTPEFIDEYREALAKLDERAKKGTASAIGTLRWLVNEFEHSHAFLKVTQREQRNRHLLVQSILDEETKPGSDIRFGDCPLRRFDAAHVRIIRDRKLKAPSAANHRLANLRVIFSWGIEERPEWVKTNPVIGVKPLAHKVEGWRPWTEEEVAQYEARHPVGTQARLALDLIQFTGARRGDVVKLGPRMLTQVKNPDTGAAETWIVFKPGKTSKSTGAEVALPLLEVLRASIAATTHGLNTFLINAWGKPHASGDSFANWFKDRCAEAGLPADCSPHGLRKIGAVRAAENGATERQMMALFGWSTSRLAAYYSKKADAMKLAAASVRTLIRR